MKKGQRVLIMDLSPNRGKTGELVGIRHGFLHRPVMRFKYIVKLDGGEVTYVGAIKRLKHDATQAA